MLILTSKSQTCQDIVFNRIRFGEAGNQLEGLIKEILTT